MASELRAVALAGIPRVRAGDDIAALIADALQRSGLTLQSGDVLVIAQKIISKAEGRLVALASITPSARAQTLAAEVDKDPRLVELILRKSTEVVRHRKNVLVVAHRNGYVLANAGIDASNVGEGRRRQSRQSRPAAAGGLQPLLPRRSAASSPR